MKRLTPARRLRQIRRARRCERIRAKRIRLPGPSGDADIVLRGILVAPRRINLIRGSDRELVKFLRAAARHVLTVKKPLLLDFRLTHSFYPTGTLLMFAELDRIVQLSVLPKPITIKPPQRRRPREVMKQIGLFDVTGDSVDLIPERTDVVYWRATKGSDQSGDRFGPLFEHVTARIDKHAAAKLAANVWPGLSEAIANTVDHAYHESDRGDGYPHCPSARWWMFTQVRDGVFIVAVCDLGIGYYRRAPSSLGQAFLASISDLLSGTNRDSRAVQAAMAYGKSSTGGLERGKGSRDALSVLQHHGEGELIILSNTGGAIFRLEKGKQEPEMHQLEIEAKSLATIVWWKLPIATEAI